MTEKPPTRCIQCGWTVNGIRREEVWRDGEMLLLHRGGCPRPDPLTGRPRLPASL